jgi:hypothetical protein
MYLLEVRLNHQYSKIAESINNFTWQPFKDLSSRKKQSGQIKKHDSNKFDDNIIMFIDSKEKAVQYWHKKIALGQVRLLKKDIEEEDKALEQIKKQITNEKAK